MADSKQARYYIAIECPPICDHADNKDNIHFSDTRCATNGSVQILLHFKCKVCGANATINQDRFTIALVGSKENARRHRQMLVTAPAPQAQQTREYKLTHKDKELLKRARIKADEDMN